MLDTKKVIRASIKEKMRNAYPHQMVELTAPELSYILSGGDLEGIIREVEAERNPLQQVSSTSEDCTSIGPETDKPPPVPTFEQVVKPVMQYLANNHCPHHHIVITATSAELFQGQKSFSSNEFLKD
jgi:hypothetical protein